MAETRAHPNHEKIHESTFGRGEVVCLELVRLRRELGRLGSPVTDLSDGAGSAVRAAFCAAVASAPTEPRTLVELLLGRRVVPESLATLSAASSWWWPTSAAAERSESEHEARARARRQVGEAAWEDLAWSLAEVDQLQSSGRLGYALQTIHRAAGPFCADPEVYLIRADLRLRLGAWEAACSDAAHALSLAPGAPRGHLIRAEALDLSGRRAAAQRALLEGRRQAPDSVGLRVAEAEFAARSGDAARACGLWDELVAAEASALHRIGRSRAREQRGDVAGARADAEAAVDAAPDDGRAWARRAALCESAGQMVQATEDWQRAFDADGARPEPYFERAAARCPARPAEAFVDALAACTLAAGEPRLRSDAQSLLRVLRRPLHRATAEQYFQARRRIWGHLTRLVEWMAWGAARDLLMHAAVVDPRLDLRRGVVSVLTSSQLHRHAPD